MSYIGDIRLGDTIDVKFTTVNTSGVPTTLAGTPAVSAYPGNSTTEVTGGITLTVDFDSRTGMHNVRVVASSGNGYATATNYALVITTGTVGGSSVVGYVIGEFSIENRSALMPTTATRTLDVSSGGEAGLDWANIGSPTTSVNLSGTTVGTATALGSGAVTAAVIADGAIDRATFAADTGLQTVRSNTAQAGAAGTITLDASASSTSDFYKGDIIYLTGGTGVGQYRICTAYNGTTKVATIAPNWATNPDNTSTFAVLPKGMADLQTILAAAVSTSTAQLGVNTVNAGGTAWASGAITAASIATGAIDADALATDAVTEIAGGVWDMDATGHQTQGTFGQAIGDPGADTDTIWGLANTNLDAAVSSRLAPTTAGRTLDVTANGNAGIDWNNIDNPTTAQNLSATNIDVDQVVASVTGNVGGNVTGSVGSVATGGISAASFAAGAIDAAAIADNAIDAGAIASNAITSAKIAADAITSSQLAASAIGEIADGVWDEATSGHLTAGTFGQALNIIRANTAQAGAASTITLDASASSTDDFYNNTIIFITAGTGALQSRIISDYVGSTKVATVNGNWVTNPSSDSVFVILPFGSIPGASAPTVQQIVDGVWDEPIASHLDSGSTGEALNAAGGAGDPWITTLPGSYTAGQAGYIVGTNLDAAVTSRLAPTTAGRTLDVTATGAAGIDWGNVENQSTAVNLSATNIDTDQVVATVTNGVTVTTNNDKTGYSLSSGGVQAVWDALTSALTTSGSIGKLLADNIDATVSSRSTLTAAQVWDLTSGIETSLTPRQAMRLMASALAGVLSGAATTTVTIKNAVANDTNRIVATVDADGNRTSLVYNLT